MTFPDCFITQVYPVSPALPRLGTNWPSLVVAWKDTFNLSLPGKYLNDLSRLFHCTGYPASPVSPRQGTKWPSEVVTLQRYLLTFLCLGKVQNDLSRLFHYTGISRKPWFAQARYKVTFPGCCMKRYLLTFPCLGKVFDTALWSICIIKSCVCHFPVYEAQRHFFLSFNEVLK